MPFTAHDLRYQAEQSYPELYGYLHRNAQRYLGALKFDAFEVDTVIGHVVEQLVRLGLLGGKDNTPLTALDQLTNAQFYSFLQRSIRNKAIDRLRKRRPQIVLPTNQYNQEEDDNDPLDDAAESLWGEAPFSTPEEITLRAVTQDELRAILKHCIIALQSAPNQLQAVLQELHDIGADDLFAGLQNELHISLSTTPNPHLSQHKDHAHKKLRVCMQTQSTNLTVMVALRLTLYSKANRVDSTEVYCVNVATLAQQDLNPDQVRAGLHDLQREGLLTWNGSDSVHLTSAQMKRLTHFYKEE